MADQDGRYLSLPIAASTTIVEGTMVVINADGWLIPGAAGANNRFVGIAQEGATNGTTAGATSVLVRTDPHYAELTIAGATQAGVNSKLYCEDATTVNTAGTGNRRTVGIHIKHISATLAGVLVQPEVA